MTSFINNSNSSCNTTYDELFFNILKESARTNSTELVDYFNEFSNQELICDYFKMIAIADSTTLTEPFSDNLLEDDGRISLAYENLRNIPRKIAENYATETTFLDLSFNYFKNLSFLSFFKTLNTLILDRNIDLDEKTFPYLANLEILWLNNCNIINIPKWIYRIQIQCPNLRHLSLMGNPGARTLFTGASCNEENDFRNFVMEILPNLIYLDGITLNKKCEDINISNNQQSQKKLSNKPLPIRNAKNQRMIGRNTKRNIIANSLRDLFRFNLRHRKHDQSSTTS